jgi:hypothetical protein
MKYKYRYVDQMVEMMEGSPDPAIKMAVVWANARDENLKALLQVMYDYRFNFEIGSIPKYQKKRQPGIDFHSAVKQLNQRLNNKVMGSGQKFVFVIDILQSLQDRDAEVLERALTGKITFRIPLADIRRVYPDIKGMPECSVDSPKAMDLSALQFPATIVKQLPTPEVRVVINSLGNLKFVDTDGKGLILPDKPNSVFLKILKPLRNVVLSCSFVGLTKDQTKVGNTATCNSSFAKFSNGELEKETIGIRILDIADMDTYLSYPGPSKNINMTFERRRAYLEGVDFGDNVFVRLADVIKVESLEELRKLEDDVTVSKETLRIYADKATYADSFSLLDQSAF